MIDATGVVVGLDEFEVTDAVERDDGTLEVSVRVPRPEAPCPRCGAFTSRVKEYRTQRVRDGHSFERPTVLVWAKCRFRCDTGGSVATFTEPTGQVPPRKRLTWRLRGAIARAAIDRSTPAVAALFVVSWWTAWAAITVAGRAKLAARSSKPLAHLRGGRDDVSPTGPVHDRHRQPVDGQAVGPLRGPLPQGPRRPTASPG